MIALEHGQRDAIDVNLAGGLQRPLALGAGEGIDHAPIVGRKTGASKANVSGERLRALTIHQHWAWAIVVGHKPCENRCWRTHYRGPLAIHAGLSRASLAPSRAFCRSLGVEPPDDDLLPFGAIVGIVDLVDVCEPQALARGVCSPWAMGPWCWLLENPRPITPVHCRGGQQLWNPAEPEKLMALGRQGLGAKS